jgi:hypothetical protein
MPDHQFEFVQGHKEFYGTTEFGLVQMRLNKIASAIQIANHTGDPDLGEVAE